MVITLKVSFSLVILLCLTFSFLPCYSTKPVRLSKVSAISKLISVEMVKCLKGGASKKAKTPLNKQSKKSNFFTNLLQKILDLFSINKSKKSGKSAKKSSASLSSSSTDSRLQKEVRSFLDSPPDNCELVVGSNIRTWVVKITAPEGTIYAGEKFKLKMVFPKDYPSKRKSLTWFLFSCQFQ